MDKWILFTILFLLNNTVQYASCDMFNIIPTLDSPCPGEFTGEPCFTLEQYIANPLVSLAIVSNITFELHPGNHHMGSQLSVSTINSFTMRATTTATVLCSQDAYFRFTQLQHFNISGITFVDCGMNLNSIANATFVKNSFVNKTRCCFRLIDIAHSSVLIERCIICLLYTSPSPRDATLSRMPSSA